MSYARPIRRGLALTGAMVCFCCMSETVVGQSDNPFNIQFNTINFRGEAFGGFNFQTPGFQPLSPAAIPFERIQFRGLNAPLPRESTTRSTRDRDRTVYRSRESIPTSSSESRFGIHGRGQLAERSFRRARTARTDAPSVRLARRSPFTCEPATAVRSARRLPEAQPSNVRFARAGRLRNARIARRSVEPPVQSSRLAARQPFPSAPYTGQVHRVAESAIGRYRR